MIPIYSSLECLKGFACFEEAYSSQQWHRLKPKDPNTTKLRIFDIRKIGGLSKTNIIH